MNRWIRRGKAVAVSGVGAVEMWEVVRNVSRERSTNSAKQARLADMADGFLLDCRRCTSPELR